MRDNDEKRYVWLVGGGAILALILLTVLISVLKRNQPPSASQAPVAAPQDKDKNGKKKKSKTQAPEGQQPMAWTGGATHESSGVAAVPGTDQFLFVDDKDSSNIYAVTIDTAGKQSSELIPVPLGVTVEDAEDITFDGTYFYVVGSQFRKQSNVGAGLVRFRYDANSHAVSDLQSVKDLKTPLIKTVPELAVAQGQMRTEEAINIEGLGWDPQNNRLLLGLRNPVVDGKAVLVPVSLKDGNAPLSDENISFGTAVKLDLGGLAIRSINYDPGAGHFVIIGGATEGAENEGFSLWSWDGAGATAKLMDLDKKIKPEGITAVDRNGELSLLVVGDAGYYMTLAEPAQQ